MALYITKSRLAELIVQAQAGDITNELCEAISRIAKGSQARFKFWWVEHDDFAQDCVLQTLKYLHAIDATKDCFAYITSICRTLALLNKRAWARRQGILTDIYEQGKPRKSRRKSKFLTWYEHHKADNHSQHYDYL